jgi:hypothetical protein
LSPCDGRKALDVNAGDAEYLNLKVEEHEHKSPATHE